MSRSPACCPAAVRPPARIMYGRVVGARLTDQPGASAYLMGGVVSYANEAKTNVLGVAANLIEEHGATTKRSRELDGRRSVAGASMPTPRSPSQVSPGRKGGMKDKPVGTCGSA